MPETFAERVFGWLTQKWCGLQGHNEVLHFEASRMMMRCTNCNLDSPGWDTSGRRPRRRFEGDPQRHALSRRHAA